MAQQRPSGRASAAGLDIAFEESLAEYPPASFWARGMHGKTFLMWPISEMVDETYTVYWRFCPEGVCEHTPREQKTAWKSVAGYLIANRGMDLYDKAVTVSEARRLCASDLRCSSFCYRCGADCETHGDRVWTIFFKSFETPLENIGTDVDGGDRDWRTHYLENDAWTSAEPAGCGSAKGTKRASVPAGALVLSNYTGALAQPANVALADASS